MIHYFVNRRNAFDIQDLKAHYVNSISGAFIRYMSRHEKRRICEQKLVIDCAFGVGSDIVDEFKEKLLGVLPIIAINKKNYRHLNESCGADYVHRKYKFPQAYTFDHNHLGATLDGDADRSIFL